MSADPAEPLVDGASARHAYEELRGRILRGDLAPGAAFSQVQLATQLGISRTPLREAVRQLQTEGLLETEANRRVRVSPLTTQDFEDLYAMRIALDGLAVRLTVPELTDADLRDLRACFDAARAAASGGALAGYAEPHERFHFGLYAHAGTRLLATIRELWDHAERYRRLYQRQHEGDLAALVRSATREHLVILEAAEARDAALAARLMAEHLARTALVTIARVDHRRDPARVRAALDHVYAEDPTET